MRIRIVIIASLIGLLALTQAGVAGDTQASRQSFSTRASSAVPRGSGRGAECQLKKIQAALRRALCLARHSSWKVLRQPSGPRRCEARFDRDIARIDAMAAHRGGACRFLDSGDTVVDLNTLLEWHKQVPGQSSAFDARGVGNCLDCVDDSYRWLIGTSEWLSALNGRADDPEAQQGFAGHSDWRVPTAWEWQTIIDPSLGIDSVFGPQRTAGSNYWTSTSTVSQEASVACAARPSYGDVSCPYQGKDNAYGLRAVRGGR